MKNMMEALKSMINDGWKKNEKGASEKSIATVSEEKTLIKKEQPDVLAPEEGKRPDVAEQMPESETVTVQGGYDPEPDTLTQKDVLRSRVDEYLKERHLVYQVVEDSERLFSVSLNLRLQGRMNVCRMILLATRSDIEAIAVSPITVAEEYRPAVAEFMMRANYGLKLGAFELDFRDGEVRFKSTLSAVSGEPSIQDVARVVSMPVIMFERFGDGLVKCMMGVGNPAEEIQKLLAK